MAHGEVRLQTSASHITATTARLALSNVAAHGIVAPLALFSCAERAGSSTLPVCVEFVSARSIVLDTGTWAKCSQSRFKVQGTGDASSRIRGARLQGHIDEWDRRGDDDLLTIK
jgi:hypothetical protein